MVDFAAPNALLHLGGGNSSCFSNIRNGTILFLRELAMQLVKTSVVARKHSKSGRHRHVSAAVNLFLGELSGITFQHLESLHSLGQARLMCVVSAVARIGRRYSCSICQRFICNLHRRDEIIYYCPNCLQWYEVIKGKAVPLQVWSGPEGSRKLSFPDFMTMAQDGGKVVSLTHRPPLPSGPSATGRIMSMKNSNDTIGNRTRDLPVCIVVP